MSDSLATVKIRTRIRLCAGSTNGCPTHPHPASPTPPRPRGPGGSAPPAAGRRALRAGEGGRSGGGQVSRPGLGRGARRRGQQPAAPGNRAAGRREPDGGNRRGRGRGRRCSGACDGASAGSPGCRERQGLVGEHPRILRLGASRSARAPGVLAPRSSPPPRFSPPAFEAAPGVPASTSPRPSVSPAPAFPGPASHPGVPPPPAFESRPLHPRGAVTRRSCWPSEGVGSCGPAGGRRASGRRRARR